MFGLSIRSLLVGLFTLMMVIIAGQGYLAINKISAVNDSVVDLGGNWLPSVNVVRAMTTSLARISAVEARHVYSTDDASMAKLEKELETLIGQFDAQRKRYEPLISSEEERALYRTFLKHWEDFLKVHHELITASRKNENQKAAELINGRGSELSEALAKNGRQLVDINVKGSEQAVADAAANYSATRLMTFVILAIGIAISAGAALFSFFGVARPIGHITQSMGVLAGGNTDAEIPYAARKDEIGHMAAAVRIFRDNMIANRRLEAEQKEAEQRAAAERKAAEERELAQQKAAEEKAAAERKAAMHALANSFEKAVGNIVDTVSSASTELEAAATTLTKTADTTQQLAGMVAAASEQASSNVHSVAAATDEMSSSVSEISRQVQESSRIAHNAVEQAQKTDARINALSQAANRIGDVVKLITAVAEQTKPPRVECHDRSGPGPARPARASPSSPRRSRRSPPRQPRRPTKSPPRSPACSRRPIWRSPPSRRSAAPLAGYPRSRRTIAAAVEEQGAATQEIARNVQQAATGTSQVATNITDVNRGAAETGSASTQVLASAQSLAKESTFLRTRGGQVPRQRTRRLGGPAPQPLSSGTDTKFGSLVPLPCPGRGAARSGAKRSGVVRRPNRGLAPMLAWASAAARPRLCDAADRKERSAASRPGHEGSDRPNSV